MKLPPKEVVAARFWPKVRKGDGCWVWAGSTRLGYGVLNFLQDDGTRRKEGAHRLAWWLEHGEMPSLLRHKCDNPACVRIDHLETGTVADNNRDMRERGRMSCGERHYNAKLTADNVRAMRRLREAGWTYKQLADTFQLGMGTVQQIITRRRWRHVA